MTEDNRCPMSEVLNHEWRVNIKGVLQIIYGAADRLETIERQDGGDLDVYASVVNDLVLCSASVERCADIQKRRNVERDSEQ